MAEHNPFVDPSVSLEDANPRRPDAVILEGRTLKGKACRLVDNTASAPHAELEILLQALIEHDKFRLGGLSVAGGNTISIGTPESAHVQLGDKLYRLLVFDYEARLEPF